MRRRHGALTTTTTAILLAACCWCLTCSSTASAAATAGDSHHHQPAAGSRPRTHKKKSHQRRRRRESTREYQQQLEHGALKEELTNYPEGLPGSADTRLEAVLGGDGIAVRSSTIHGAGRGSFAGRAFVAGETLCEYKGVVVPYASHLVAPSLTVTINSTHVLDASPLPLRNPCRYINSVCAAGTCHAQNAQITITPDGAVICKSWQDCKPLHACIHTYATNSPAWQMSRLGQCEPETSCLLITVPTISECTYRGWVLTSAVQHRCASRPHEATPVLPCRRWTRMPRTSIQLEVMGAGMP
jgi:hypothetical protein